MPLKFSAAHSSRITKRRQTSIPSLKRSTSSPFAGLNQRKPIKRSLTECKADDKDDNSFEDRLEDRGIVKSLAPDLSPQDVTRIIQYVHSHMFEVVPESGGFNSTRIAEILNFRESLPPTVTVAHVHALSDSPTKTEKEIAELIKAGVIRRIVIPGRGGGGSSVGDGLILLKDIETLVGQADGLDQSSTGELIGFPLVCRSILISYSKISGNPPNKSSSSKYFS